MRWVILSAALLLASCAHVGERGFAKTVSRFQADPAFRAQVVGPLLWVTETTIWQDEQGYDRTVSCTAIRPLEWFGARGYRMIPSAEEAAREGLIVEKKMHSAVTADVRVGPPKTPPEAIYSFYRDESEWELSGVEVFSRIASEDGKPPAHRCLATE